MANYRQTNHNGRVSNKSGSVYNRDHNDRQFDVSHAENINADMIKQNIIIHYDVNNKATVIDNNNPNRKSINQHEHEMYEFLFSESLEKQHARNNAARHPERNKCIEDLLDGKNTCPEETIFQIGSVEDGFPEPDVLMAIFEDYQNEIIKRYGNNIHFLDVALHMDEAVPHLHIRKVWTYTGKDGLDISQNKALDEMGFERPNPEKSPTRWNNAKIAFSEWERELKLSICEAHGLSVERTPKSPGKATMEKEEAIALKLQAQNQEYREETDRLIDERDKAISDKDKDIAKKQQKLDKISADLVTEEMKNKEVADTNIFGKPKQITMSAQEFRSWQKSAETKENNERMQTYFKAQTELLNDREKDLDKREHNLDVRELSIDSEVNKRVSAGIKEQMPEAITEAQNRIKSEKRQLTIRENRLDERTHDINEKERLLDRREERQLQDDYWIAHEKEALQKRSAELVKKEESFAARVNEAIRSIIQDRFQNFFQKYLVPIFKRFNGKHQEEVLNIMDGMLIDHPTALKLEKAGYPALEGHPLEDALDQAEEKDIVEAIKLVDNSIDDKDIKPEDINNVINSLRDGATVKDVAKSMAQTISDRYIPMHHRGHVR